MTGNANESKLMAIVAIINSDFCKRVVQTGSFNLYLSIRFITATPFKTH